MRKENAKYILGIESSCDETSASVVTNDRQILSNVVLSQTKHFEYGGVVPELAARAHLQSIDSIILEAMHQAKLDFNNLDGIAATAGPGLIGGVIIGTMAAKAIALSLQKPYFAINHLEAHALTARLTDNLPFPYLLLLVSGGHCQLLIVNDVGSYEKLGTTIDDAIGEAFDKTGRLLGFSYPAGPMIERTAKSGNPHSYTLPKPLYGRPGSDFSFSGLKTAVRKIIEDNLDKAQDDQFKADLCASFQYTIGEILKDRLKNGLTQFKNQYPEAKHFVLAGGVAANQYLRDILQTTCTNHSLELIAPPISLCTDNAAMIAWVGQEKLRLNQLSSLNFAPRPRWPLDEL